MAARAYSKDKEKDFNEKLIKSGNVRYRVAQSMTPFEGKDDTRMADRRVADLLKEMFRHHLPKMPDAGSVQSGDDFEDNDGDQLMKGEFSQKNLAAEETKKEAEVMKEEDY